MVITVRMLIWDDWNRQHIAQHAVTPPEVEEVCHGKFKVIESFRKRLEIKGRTQKGKQLIVILSPEDRKLQVYGKGIYYPITAFEEVD